LHDLVIPEHRAAFMADPEALFEKFKLSEQERDMVRRRDWRAMMQYGTIFFVLEKLAAVSGVSNLHVYSHINGHSLDDFLMTRNSKVRYSVCGKETHDKVKASGT